MRTSTSKQRSPSSPRSAEAPTQRRFEPTAPTPELSARQSAVLGVLRAKMDANKHVEAKVAVLAEIGRGPDTTAFRTNCANTGTERAPKRGTRSASRQDGCEQARRSKGRRPRRDRPRPRHNGVSNQLRQHRN